MHRCSIEVRDVNYASLCDHRTIQTFLLASARAIGAERKAEPQFWELTIKEPAEHTVLWMMPLVPRGWIILEVFLCGQDKGCFTLDACSMNPVEKRRILAVVEKTFCERDSIGQRVSSRLVKGAA